jgi:hypothetical protein
MHVWRWLEKRLFFSCLGGFKRKVQPQPGDGAGLDLGGFDALQHPMPPTFLCLCTDFCNRPILNIPVQVNDI